MEIAKHLCENLRQQYPNDSFVAYTDDSNGYGNHALIFNMIGVKVCRLIRSNAKIIGDSALKSLLHRVVFESKLMNDNVERARQLFDEIDKMLPDSSKTVFATNVNSNDCPVVYGPHKGLAYFSEPEFGTHVTIVLH